MGRPARRQARRPDERRGDSRLQLAEFLLLSDSPVDGARHLVTWLTSFNGARHVVCAALDASRTRLTGLAVEGVPLTDPESFTVDLEQTRHPFVMLLARSQPTLLRMSARQTIDGLRLPHGSYIACPLHGLYLDEDLHVGVLLVGPAQPTLLREVRWAANLFGP